MLANILSMMTNPISTTNKARLSLEEIYYISKTLPCKENSKIKTPRKTNFKILNILWFFSLLVTFYMKLLLFEIFFCYTPGTMEDFNKL